jgi:hypothetical protein
VLSQPLLFNIARPDRIYSSYCHISDTPHLDDTREDHYTAINPVLRGQKQTIEIRIREGIIDIEQITHWVNLLVSLADAKRISKAVCDISDLKKVIKLKSDAEKSFNTIMKKHNKVNLDMFPLDDRKDELFG